jgi:hypothetical protein
LVPGANDPEGLRDLSIAQEFANAVCHFLRHHRYAKPSARGGIELPLDRKVWRAVLRMEYKPSARKSAQSGSLQAYCDYYNGGTKGHGYDLDGVWDCGTLNRTGKQRVGRSLRVNYRDKTVHPGTKPPYVKPEEVIAIIRKRLPEIPTARAGAAAAKLEAQPGQRKANRKRVATRKTKREATAFSNADASAEDVNSIWRREDIDSTTKEKLVKARLGRGRFEHKSFAVGAFAAA